MLECDFGFFPAIGDATEPNGGGDDPVADAYALAWFFKVHPDEFLSGTISEIAEHVRHWAFLTDRIEAARKKGAGDG